MNTSQERVDETPKNEHDIAEADQDDLTVAYMSGLYEGKKRREWVGLTDEDIWQLRRDGAHEVSDKHFKAIEAKLKEKNA